MTTYTIKSTAGHHLPMLMTVADSDDVYAVLRAAERYIYAPATDFAPGEIEDLDGGDIVLGALVARPDVAEVES